ncbi:Gfo/Idh/MocA family protein [Alicyclobacillus ferrooxydans]|uniref:Oxidoreductase n=1 Tax=Alicyclobacillus ferrooxydans TaxID=471514 RepID=A0A0P9CE94_9BACL|nr:Gfo/Idh/MocA family oxidoreductase [Alicyclobacillus ferrooxydans]KPV43929.1 hypothetical protein AN477_09380 [Alicyclobacillus ferrooxydans]
MRKVRVGIVGLGAIATIAHLKSYAKRDDVEIVAFVDTETDRVQEASVQFGRETGRPVPKVYGSFEDMVQSHTINAVSICTPNTAHAGYVLQALQYGVDVLVEKPLCTTLSEADEIYDMTAATDRVVMVGMSHRYRTDVQVMKRFIDNGDLGDVYYGKVRILRRRGVPKGWFTNEAVSGGGPLMDLGVHALDLAWWLTGMHKIQSVSGMMTKAIGADRVDYLHTWEALSKQNANNEIFTTEDFAAAFLRFDNGSVLQMEVAWAVNSPEDGGLKLELFGTRGGISTDPAQVVTVDQGALATTPINVGMGSLYDQEIDHFLTCVKTRCKPVSDVSQGREIVRMLNMIATSAKEWREVRV